MEHRRHRDPADLRTDRLGYNARMMRRHLAPFLLLPLVACTATIHLHSDWATWSWLGTEPSNECKSLAIECAPAAIAVRTKLQTSATGGELVLRLVAPDGVERCRQVVRSGKGEVVQSWPAQTGRWVLHVDAVDFTGSYDIQLDATDAPIQVHVEIAGDTPR